MQRMKIRFYREQKGMTREELAAKVGISHEDLFDYENHFRSPTLTTVEAIADALDVTVEDLVRGV